MTRITGFAASDRGTEAMAQGDENTEHLHRIYCRLSAAEIPLRAYNRRWWDGWIRSGFGEPELRLVMKHLQAEIGAGRRNLGALKLRNLLAVDRFEEDLHIARAWQKARGTAPSAEPIVPIPTLEQTERCLVLLREWQRDFQSGAFECPPTRSQQHGG